MTEEGQRRDPSPAGQSAGDPDRIDYEALDYEQLLNDPDARLGQAGDPAFDDDALYSDENVVDEYGNPYPTEDIIVDEHGNRYILLHDDNDDDEGVPETPPHKGKWLNITGLPAANSAAHYLNELLPDRVKKLLVPAGIAFLFLAIAVVFITALVT